MAKNEKPNGWKDYSDVLNAAKNNTLGRLFLFTGDEQYLVSNTLRKLRSLYVEKSASDIDCYVSDRSSNGISFDEFESLVLTPPFMSQRRITILKQTGLWSNRAPDTPEAQKKMKQVLGNIPEFALVIFVEDKVDKRKKALLDAVTSNGEVVLMDKQDDAMLSRWIQSTMKNNRLEIEQSAVTSLIERSEHAMLTIENEVEKIMLYCKGTNKVRVNLALIDELCVPDVSATIFQMTDAIGNKRPDQALFLMNQLISLKEPVTKIRFMLARHIRQLICAKELGSKDVIASRLKVHPFVARNLVTQADHFSMKQLERMYKLTFKSDVAVKSGKMEERMALEVLLVAAGQM